MLIIIKVAVYSKTIFHILKFCSTASGFGFFCWSKFKTFWKARAAVRARRQPRGDSSRLFPPEEGPLQLQTALPKPCRALPLQSGSRRDQKKRYLNSTSDFCIECSLRCTWHLNIARDPVSVLTNLGNKA